MTAKRVLTRLKKVRALLAEPEHWCQNQSAMDAHGEPAFSQSRDAVAFCLMGAVTRVSDAQRGYVHILSALSAALPKRALGLVTYNDARRRTHAQILALIDRAINLTESAI